MRKEQIYLLLILILALFLRLLPIWGNNFVFMFDHAKDSLVVMEMGVFHKPALFGAVTSIPGVYYGPLFYYLALPLNFFLAYQPIASVLTHLILTLLVIYLTAKYLGKLEAFLLATSWGLIAAQNSAWTPYMTPLLTTLILIVLLKKNKYKIFYLAFLSSLTFHFQPAWGVVLLPTVLVILLMGFLPASRGEHLERTSRRRIFLDKRGFLLAIFIFLLPFTPQLIFELRHDWHQTREVISFVQNYGNAAHELSPNQKGLGRVLEVGTYLVEQVGAAIAPIKTDFKILYLTLALSCLLGLRRAIGEGIPVLTGKGEVFLPFILVPLAMYQFFPCKSYYLVAVQPVFIFLLAAVIRRFVKVDYVKYLVIFFVILALFNLRFNILNQQQLAQTDRILYAPKLAAVEKVYQLAAGKKFASYHYVREIYDYTYQHIYLSKYYQHPNQYYLPSEFSYAPGETSYLLQKHVLANASEAEKLFLIVEKYENKNEYQKWLDRLNVNLLVEYKINQAITVYEASFKK